jgi:excinuclease ABC subunit A
VPAPDALPVPLDLPRAIAVRGVRHNTLRDLDVDVPLWRTVAIVGVSGSGKTSLAMGTLHAEGMHRFLEGLSTYSRRRMSQAQRPDVDRIEHLPPALALRQRPPIPGPRSTVGTMSEVLNVLRLIMSRLGHHRCPNGHMVPPSIATQAMEIACPECGATFETPGAESFAFNSHGACPACDGLGERTEIDPAALVPDGSKTIEEGAVLSWNVGGRRLSRYAAQQLGVRLDVPWDELSDAERDTVMHGEPVRKHVSLESRGKVFELNVLYDNAITAAERNARSDNEISRNRAQKFLSTRTCSVCKGTRLRPEALASRLDGRSIAELAALDLGAVRAFADTLGGLTPDSLARLVDGLARELIGAVDPLLGLGLGYLALDRAGSTLSTGERQRIELTSTVRTNTTGMLYVLDEPSVGLHPQNVAGLRETIAALVANGNSVVIVEHDLALVRTADWVIELGPGAGRAGGTIVAQGPPDAIGEDPDSVVGPYLTGAATVRRVRPAPEQDPGALAIEISSLFNLRDVRVEIPLRGLTAFAGPSGAGKTAIVLDSLVPAARAALDGGRRPAWVRSLDLGPIRQVAGIDASPIGQNARSTPATYSGALDHIRRLYALTPEASARGWAPGRFSFNTREGQCPVCRGLGAIDLDVQYLPDINVVCPECEGDRFNPETLEIVRDGLTIARVLELTVREALEHFADERTVAGALRPIAEVGLGYLRLGEPTPSLSGGEAQRLRIASRLRSSQRDTLYVFDEPSTGLHPLDIAVLIGVFDRLLDDGATIVVIDHDLDVLAAADHVIDVGPGGGREGGRIVASGTPEAVAADPASVTGPYLAEHLAVGAGAGAA